MPCNLLFLFSGNFEPPGARAVNDYVVQQRVETHPAVLAARKTTILAERGRDAGPAPSGEAEIERERSLQQN